MAKLQFNHLNSEKPQIWTNEQVAFGIVSSVSEFINAAVNLTVSGLEDEIELSD